MAIIKRWNKKINLFLAALAAIALVFMYFQLFHREKGETIQGTAHYESGLSLDFYDNYYQGDNAWADNRLGKSSDTMSKSGCLTSCVAASLKAQGLYEYTPGELNQLFNENNVYTESGAILWKELEQALPMTTVSLVDHCSNESVNRMIEEDLYPIVKVRRKSGAVHWVMLTGTEEDTYDIIALDPIDGYVRMSDYKNRIYGLRIVTGQ